MRYIAPFWLLLLLGCGQSQRETELAQDRVHTNDSQAVSVRNQKAALSSEGLTNKPVKFRELSDQSQIKVLVCDYVIRHTLADQTTVVIAVLDAPERDALASRLPGFVLRSITQAETKEDARGLVDEQSKERGVKLEVSAIVINEHTARALASWGDFTSRDFSLEKTDEWRIRKVGPIGYIDYYPVK